MKDQPKSFLIGRATAGSHTPPQGQELQKNIYIELKLPPCTSIKIGRGQRMTVATFEPLSAWIGDHFGNVAHSSSNINIFDI